VAALFDAKAAPPSVASVAGLALEVAGKALRLWTGLPSFPEIAGCFREVRVGEVNCLNGWDGFICPNEYDLIERGICELAIGPPLSIEQP
jgi:hypothetical protein